MIMTLLLYYCIFSYLFMIATALLIIIIPNSSLNKASLSPKEKKIFYAVMLMSVIFSPIFIIFAIVLAIFNKLKGKENNVN